MTYCYCLIKLQSHDIYELNELQKISRDTQAPQKVDQEQKISFSDHSINHFDNLQM